MNCEAKDLAALTGELSTTVNLRPDGDAAQVAAELRRYLGSKRCLLFLDNVEDDQPGQLVPQTGKASVLVTSRSTKFRSLPMSSPSFLSCLAKQSV